MNLWYHAVNHRKKMGLTHYAMMHDDIIPQDGWLDILLDEMDRTGADVLSVITPIKDDHGLTSTGILLGGVHDGVRRFTMTEVMEELPETFCAADLPAEWKGVPNKGLAVGNSLWICKFTEPWITRTVFAMTNFVLKEYPDGTDPAELDEDGFEKNMIYHPGIDTDDWKFSRWAQQVEKLKVFATRKVKLGHVGSYEFRNDHAWGTWKTDGEGKTKMEAS